MTILMVGAVSALTVENPTVTPTNPTTEDTVEICADVDGEGLDIVSVELSCSSNHPFIDEVMSDEGHPGEYCTEVWFSTWQDGEDISCEITATDEESNVETAEGPEFTYDGEEPVAEFTCEPTEGDEPLITACTSTSHDSVSDHEDLTHEWDYPEGVLVDETEDSITIRYEQEGDYTISLTVTDEAGFSNTLTREDYITVEDTDPEANFEYDGNLEEGEEISFTDTSSSYDGIIAWEWDFGDGETSEEPNPMHTYADNGEYEVTLTVYEEDGDSAYAEANIEIANVAPEFSEIESYECDEGETISLTASATDVEADYPLIYEWDLDGDDEFETPGQSVEYTCENNGEITVIVRVTDQDEESRTAEVDITINNVPPTANAGGPYRGVINEEVQLSGSAEDNYDEEFTYGWDCNYDGEFVMDFSGQTVSCVYEELGTYIAALRVHDGDNYSEIAEAEVTVYDYQIALSEDWNLISIPLVPEDTSIDEVLGEEVSSNADVIWAYVYDEEEGRNVWKYNMPIEGNWSSERTLNDIIPGYGYYIKMNSEVTVYNDGERMYGNNEFTVPKPPVVTLIPSWNLIGHYGMEEDINKENALDTLDSSYSTLLDKDGYSVSEMNPTEGYWLFITGTNNLDYAPSNAAYPSEI